MNSQMTTTRQAQSAGYTKKVSVLMTTYNHEAYIAQAIESALMQVTDFDFEIVIGEDCSTDRTPQIVGDFVERYPSKIRPILRDRNVGMLPNLVETLESCQGQYIALLEGDDYWTSDIKLQRQVGYLDARQECSICFHDVSVVNDNNQQVAARYVSPDQKQIAGIEDLLTGNFIPTCSVMFRNRLFSKFPDWFYSLGMGDWPLHIFNAENGRIIYIDEVMATYRMHRGGVWSTSPKIPAIEGMIEVLQHANAHFDGKYGRIIRSTIASCYFALAMEYGRGVDSAKAKSYALRLAKLRLSTGAGLTQHQWKLLFSVFAPSLYSHLKSVRARPKTESNLTDMPELQMQAKQWTVANSSSHTKASLKEKLRRVIRHPGLVMGRIKHTRAIANGQIWRIYLMLRGSRRRLGSGTLVRKSLRLLGPGHVTIGVSADIHDSPTLAATRPGSRIQIGARAIINGAIVFAQNEVTIGDDAILSDCSIVDNDGHHLDPTRRRSLTPPPADPIRLGNNVWIGSRATILKGVTIGDNSVVGAGAVVTKNVPANVVVAGNPAQVVKHINPNTSL